MSVRQLLVRDCMTPQPHAVRASDTIAQAKALMERFRIRHLPVLNVGGKPVGMLSERDINLICGLEGIEPHNVLAIDACHGKPYVVDPKTPLRDVVNVMVKTRYGSAIVMDQWHLVGIFTTVDACRTLGLLLSGKRRPSA